LRFGYANIQYNNFFLLPNLVERYTLLSGGFRVFKIENSFLNRYDVISDYIHYNFLYNNLLNNDLDQILFKRNRYKNILENLVYKNYYSLYASLSSFVNMSMNNDVYNIFKHHYYLGNNNFLFHDNNEIFRYYDKL